MNEPDLWHLRRCHRYKSNNHKTSPKAQLWAPKLDTLCESEEDISLFTGSKSDTPTMRYIPFLIRQIQDFCVSTNGAKAKRLLKTPGASTAESINNTICTAQPSITSKKTCRLISTLRRCIAPHYIAHILLSALPSAVFITSEAVSSSVFN